MRDVEQRQSAVGVDVRVAVAVAGRSGRCGLAARGRLLQDEVHVGAADAEGGHARPADRAVAVEGLVEEFVEATQLAATSVKL